jgi:hypothetical protein
VLLVSRLPAWIGESVRELWLRAADSGCLGYRHRLQPWGFGSAPAAACVQTILDLDRLSLPPSQPALLVSHAYRQSPVPHYPSIESWAVLNGVSCSQAAAYRRIQFHTIRRRLRAPSQALDGAYALLPHLTSHFGHWVGDQLGAILWFATDPRVRAGGRRLLVTAPSPAWAQALTQLCPPDSLAVFTPEQLLQANLRLADALLLPRLSSWQNLALARDRLGAALGPPAEPERLFLCSRRSDRIANLAAVCERFERHGYTVLDPTGLPSLVLLRRLRDAAGLWCEHGSMVLNALLCRSRPYRLFSLDPVCAGRHDDALTVLGGSLYNSVQRGLQQPFACAPAEDDPRADRQLHPYQRRLRVDLEALDQALSQERNHR